MCMISCLKYVCVFLLSILTTIDIFNSDYSIVGSDYKKEQDIIIEKTIITW